MVELTLDEWEAQGRARYGDDKTQWVFQCPCCKVHTKAQEWIEAQEPSISFSCIGRTHARPQSAVFGEKLRPVGCDYAGGGFFKLNPIKIIDEDGNSERIFNFSIPIHATIKE